VPSFSEPRALLNKHFNFLKDNQPVPIDITGIISEVGDHHVSTENETKIGIPSIDTINISLKPDPVLAPVIDVLRDPESELWMEVVLVQEVLDCPKYKEGAGFLWPRKERLWYWGRSMPMEDVGKVATKDYPPQHTNKLTTTAVRHRGELQLSFVHWLKATGSGQVRTFLNSVRGGTTFNSSISLQGLFQKLLLYISPSSIFYAADRRLLGPDPKRDPTRSFLDIQLHFSISDGSVQKNELFDIHLKVVTGAFLSTPGHYTALFYDAPDGSNDQSLYGCKDLAELLYKLSQEVLLFPQVEIPTMEEASGNPITAMTDTSASERDRITYWNGVTRWLFLPIGEFGPDIYLQPAEGTIEYTPSGVYVSSCKVEQPTVQNLLPAPAWSMLQGRWVGGKDITHKTLLRFVGQVVENGIQKDSPRGWELYIDNGGLQYARFVSGSGIGTNNWAYFHAYARMARWGSARAIVKFTSRGVGLEPFGASATLNGKPITKMQRHFGRNDFGEFPLLRRIEGDFGLLTNRQYQVLDIQRTQGGNTQVTLLEYGETEGVVFDSSIAYTPPSEPPKGPPEPPPPPPTWIEPPPLIPIPATVNGIVTVQLATWCYTPLAQIKVYAAGEFLDVTTVTNSDGLYTFEWDTRLYPNGNIELKAVSIDNNGETSYSTNTVNIDNPV